MKRSFRDAWLSHRNMNLREQVRVSLGGASGRWCKDTIMRICEEAYFKRVRYINSSGDEYHLRRLISDSLKRNFDHRKNH